MKKYITVLAIAGSDSCGGAGLQGDIKTISALGCYAAGVVTAVTVQNTCGVQAVHPVPGDIVKEQIRCVTDDLPPQAVKIGMVTDESIVHAIADGLAGCSAPVVFDPVLASSSGASLVEPQALGAICRRLVPLCRLLTPNLRETEILSGMTLRTPDDRFEAGRRILALGCRAVLVKGGHLPGDDTEDLLFTASPSGDVHRFHGRRIASRNTHGTGCTLSSAIAAYIARGCELPEAVRRGKEYLAQALAAGKDVAAGHGSGPLNHFFDPTPLIIR